jgi:hypothetical protein
MFDTDLVQSIKAMLQRRNSPLYAGNGVLDIAFATLKSMFNPTLAVSSLSSTLLEAVRDDGMAIMKIPHELLTPEIIMEAVKSDGFAIRYVPEYMLTFDICEAALRRHGLALGHVPHIFHTESLYLIAVTQNGLALEFVRIQTARICRAAVAQNGYAIGYVRNDLVTYEIMHIASKTFPSVFRKYNVPRERRLEMTGWE